MNGSSCGEMKKSTASDEMTTLDPISETTWNLRSELLEFGFKEGI